MRHDAALTDVFFTNPSLGWAVGDRGVIWSTTDGGTTWQQQQSNVTCRLSAVYFIDDRRGWAVGGECRPLSNSTRGVVLCTADGGETWSAVPHLILPSLVGVKFFDPIHGIAFGQSAAAEPSGVFTTHDGGKTWQALPSDGNGAWLAGDFLGPNAGALAGPAGELATVARHQVVHSPFAAASLRSFRAMRLIAPTGGWAVGDGGLLLTTHDLGRSWQTPPTDLPEIFADNFDFHAVAVQGTHVWVAGTPGTRIIHSPNDGQTWESLPTGQNAPLRALTFVDTEHGWAVGDFGNILATSDGGRSWHSQRSGGERVALLALFADPANVPLELLADAGAADGYIAAVNLLCTPLTDVEPATQSAIVDRWQQTMLLSGAATTSCAWRFPLPNVDLALERDDLLKALNRENDGRALQQLQAYLVRELRTWRPDVVVTNQEPLSANPQSAIRNPQSSLASLLEQMLAEAISAAADPSQHPEFATDLGLAPWQVKKVYCVLGPGQRGDDVLPASRFSPWLGAALSDYVQPSRSLLNSSSVAPPDSYEFKLRLSTVPQATNSRGLFAGISLAPGCDARRPQADLPTQDLEALRRLATRRRHLQELIEHTEGNVAWASQVSTMIDGLSSDDAGQLLVQLAEGYRKSGRLDLAADTYFLLTRRFPDHPLAVQSLDWLVKFYASSELATRLQQSTPSTMNRGKEVAEFDIRQTSAALPTSKPNLTRDARLRRAAQLADYLKSARPAVYAEPSVRFAEVAAERELGYANPAQRLAIALNQMPESNPWRECAATEQWLAQPADMPPAKKLATCRTVDQPPTLDAKLNEPLWKAADRMKLGDDNVGRTILSVQQNPETDKSVRPTATVQLARDAQFLYVAIHAPKVADVDYTADDSPRSRDADLMQHDRVTLRIDTDRDYSTAFELTVDHRGWTNDSCWEDPTWNPNWYVAASADDTSWTVEAAIPLAELAQKLPASRAVWAISARRIIPRTGYETWAGTTTSAADSPSQFGLLIFE
jgi:photosystem II stability/assembly factor-like uncharacterized protein